MAGVWRLKTTATAFAVLALVTADGPRCVDCRPAPVPCPPCFVCIQTHPAAIPPLPCPLPGRTT